MTGPLWTRPLDLDGSRIVVLKLEGQEYRVLGEHGRGERASWALLKGFVVDVDLALAAAKKS